jgi:thiamine biosynthesis lipoprotein
VDAWAARLTRFDPSSELSRLNGDAGSVRVGPTLARVLQWSADASAMTDGIVTPTLLAERLAAEDGAPASPRSPAPWRVDVHPRGGEIHRPPGVGIDLDGVAKGWLADRALRLLDDLPGAIVDADGDIAIRLAPGDDVVIGVADPWRRGELLTALRLPAGHARLSFGLATSGTAIHRWPGRRHHLIDPRIGAPARTDIVQATVLAATAAEADVLAKTAVILGRSQGVAFLDDRRAFAAILLGADGECLATPSSLSWLAAA